MDKSRRKNPRISSRIRVEFIERSRTESITTNVSRNGIFIRGESTRATNSLVRLRLFVPPNNKSLEIFGRIAWHGSSEGQKGIGIHFMELASKDRERWTEFVAQVEQLDAGNAPTVAEPSSRVSQLEPERRKTTRTESSFMVRFKSKEKLESFVTKNLSEGGMFLSTPVLKPVGTKIQVVLIHPNTARDFEIAAEVVRLNEHATPEEAKGMALRFLSLDAETNEDLKIFLSE